MAANNFSWDQLADSIWVDQPVGLYSWFTSRRRIADDPVQVLALLRQTVKDTVSCECMRLVDAATYPSAVFDDDQMASDFVRLYALHLNSKCLTLFTFTAAILVQSCEGLPKPSHETAIPDRRELCWTMDCMCCASLDAVET